jgi:hypothetical protein
MKVTRHHERAYEDTMAAEGNLWAFAWCQNSRQLLSVRNIVMNEGEVEKEVVLDIGEPIHVSLIICRYQPVSQSIIHQATLSIMSGHHILVTSCSRVSLYDIPELEPVAAGVNPHIIPVTPVWVRFYEDRYNYPPVSPVHWNASGCHDRPLVLFTGSTLRFFHQSLDDQCPSYYFLDSFWVRNHNMSSIDARPTLSARRVIWSEKGKLQTCVFPLIYGGRYDGALLRFGYTETGLRIAPIDLGTANVEGNVMDVSWDEPSGRLCVLVYPDTSLHALKILIVDSL